MKQFNLKRKALAASLLSLMTAVSVFAASEGNNGGGGGNTLAPVPATRAEVRAAIANIDASLYSATAGDRFSTKQITFEEHTKTDIFKNIRSAAWFYVLPESADEVLRIHKSITLRILDKSSCEHRNSQGQIVSSEGSSDSVSRTICLSISAIQRAGHTAADIQRKVFGLYMHEFLEIVGLSHEEAVKGQKEFELRNIDSSIADYYDFLSKLQTFNRSVGQFDKMMKGLKQNSKEACYAFGTLISQIPESYDATGRDLINKHRAWELDVQINAHLGNIRAVCSGQEIRQAYNKAFQTAQGKRKNTTTWLRLGCFLETDNSLVTKINYDTSRCIEQANIEDTGVDAFGKPLDKVFMIQLPYIKSGDVKTARAELNKVVKDFAELESMIRALPKTYNEYDFK